MSEEQKPAASPTGTPLVPPKYVPYIVALATLAIAISGIGELEPFAGWPPKATKLAEGALALCFLLLGMSPGARLKGAAAVAAVQAAAKPPEEPKP